MESFALPRLRIECIEKEAVFTNTANEVRKWVKARRMEAVGLEMGGGAVGGSGNSWGPGEELLAAESP